MLEKKKKEKEKQRFHKKTPVLEFLINIVVFLKAVTQVFPYEKIFYVTPPMAVSDCLIQRWTFLLTQSATFQQNMVECSINWQCCKVFHQADFRFGSEEVQIDVEHVLWLANSKQKLPVDTER